jgi:hypothetical protein
MLTAASKRQATDDGGTPMTGKPGERIEVESEAVGQPTREGEILEVIQGEVGIRYRVRWSDGHESVFSPSGGSARIVAAVGVGRAKPRAATPNRTTAKRSSANRGTSKDTAARKGRAKR